MRTEKSVFFALLLLALALVPSAVSYAGATSAETRKMFPDGVTIAIGTSQPITFVPTKLKYLSQAYVKLTGVDLGDDKLVDDFSAINYCNVLSEYYKDEFAWRQAREAVRAAITRNLESYPEYFYILGTLPIGRYDFDKKAFILDEAYKMRRTGMFNVEDRNFDCGNYRVDRMPIQYAFRLTNPVTLDKLDIPEDKAFAITRHMDKVGNTARIVYVVFYLRVNDFSTISAGGIVGVDSYTANVRASLLSMRLYLDPERKQMIYEYTGE